MNYLALVPLIGSVCAMFAFFTSYIVAVVRGDVYPWWPYISDTGTTIPESCIFGQLLTMSAIFGFCGMIIRYKWVQLYNPDKNLKLTKLNCISFGIGAVSCFGMTMVANFEETSLRAVHMPSAVVTFSLGLVYNFIHTEITRVMSPRSSSFCVWVLRLCISMTGLVAFILLYGFGVSAEIKGKRWYGNDSLKKLDWDPQDPGWGLHLVASVSEWIIGLSVVVFFLTFISEFSRVKLSIKAVALDETETTPDETSPLLTSA